MGNPRFNADTARVLLPTMDNFFMSNPERWSPLMLASASVWEL